MDVARLRFYFPFHFKSSRSESPSLPSSTTSKSWISAAKSFSHSSSERKCVKKWREYKFPRVSCCLKLGLKAVSRKKAVMKETRTDRSLPHSPSVQTATNAAGNSDGEVCSISFSLYFRFLCSQWKVQVFALWIHPERLYNVPWMLNIISFFINNSFIILNSSRLKMKTFSSFLRM